MNRANIGSVIRGARENNRVTQAELCRALGMSRMTLNKIERGERNFSIDTFLKIAEHLGLSIDLKQGSLGEFLQSNE